MPGMSLALGQEIKREKLFRSVHPFPLPAAT
jgi:hypothetical protein